MGSAIDELVRAPLNIRASNFDERPRRGFAGRLVQRRDRERLPEPFADTSPLAAPE